MNFKCIVIVTCNAEVAQQLRPGCAAHTLRMRNALFTSQPPSQEDKRHYLSLSVVAQQQLPVHPATVGIGYSGDKTCFSSTSAKVFLLKYLSCLHVLAAFYCKSISSKLFTQCFCCPTVRACVACLKRLATK